HQVLGKRLKALASFLQTEAPDSRSRPYVDTGAVMEKAWAERAGLGWIGKHSNLVSARHGSWLLLGEVLTTADLAPDEPGADLCGTCTLCIRACPTAAIAAWPSHRRTPHEPLVLHLSRQSAVRRPWPVCRGPLGQARAPVRSGRQRSLESHAAAARHGRVRLAHAHGPLHRLRPAA